MESPDEKIGKRFTESHPGELRELVEKSKKRLKEKSKPANYAEND